MLYQIFFRFYSNDSSRVVGLDCVLRPYLPYRNLRNSPQFHCQAVFQSPEFKTSSKPLRSGKFSSAFLPEL